MYTFNLFANEVFEYHQHCFCLPFNANLKRKLAEAIFIPPEFIKIVKKTQMIQFKHILIEYQQLKY